MPGGGAKMHGEVLRRGVGGETHQWGTWWHGWGLQRMGQKGGGGCWNVSVGPEPVPAHAQPRTDPRCFIVDAPRVTSHHVTHSHHAHPPTHASTS